MITQRSLDIHDYLASRLNTPEEVQHAVRVASKVEADTGDENYYQVALLHDVIEDGYTTMDRLVKAFDLSEQQAVALDAITRREDEKYFDYILRVKRNPMAKVIKLSDLYDNIKCCAEDLDSRWGLLSRYAKAYAILTDKWDNSHTFSAGSKDIK